MWIGEEGIGSDDEADEVLLFSPFDEAVSKF
jgi:hypothetical protein